MGRNDFMGHWYIPYPFDFFLTEAEAEQNHFLTSVAAKLTAINPRPFFLDSGLESLRLCVRGQKCKVMEKKEPF